MDIAEELIVLHRRLDTVEREIAQLKAGFADARGRIAVPAIGARPADGAPWQAVARELREEWQILMRSLALWAEHVDRHYGDGSPPNPSHVG
ncbi:MAG: hypothetical protein AB7K86_02095 [Rhodospirillales bacterium]